jgi:hypothetical protein
MLFSELKPATKAVYHILEHFNNHKTNKFYWKIAKIAKRSGVSHDSVQRAEIELESAGVIEFVKRLPHCKQYQFIKKIEYDDDLNVDNSDSDHASMPNENTHPCVVSSRTHASCKQTPTLSPLLLKQTTDKIDPKLYSNLVSQYGQEKVDVVVVSLNKMENVKNFNGYLQSALKNGYIPINKTIKEQEQKEKKRKQIDLEIENQKQKWKQIEKDFEKSYNPEKVNKIIQDCISKLQ